MIAHNAAAAIEQLADIWVQKSGAGRGWYLWYSPIPNGKLVISSGMPNPPSDWCLATGDVLGLNREEVITQIWEETRGLLIYDPYEEGEEDRILFKPRDNGPMEKASYYTYEELVEEGIAQMEKHFQIILHDMLDSHFYDMKAPAHCAAWREMRIWRDRILSAKNLFTKDPIQRKEVL